MEHNISKSEVTEKVKCDECGAIIPSDEEEAINHLIREHGYTRGTHIHNIARLCFKKVKNPKGE